MREIDTFWYSILGKEIFIFIFIDLGFLAFITRPEQGPNTLPIDPFNAQCTTRRIDKTKPRHANSAAVKSQLGP